MPTAKPIRIFIAYSTKDFAFKEEIRKRLIPLIRIKKVTIWDNYDIEAGANWDADIRKNLAQSDLILLLLSPDALASDYFYEVEAPIALERHQAGEAITVGIMLRPCSFRHTPFELAQYELMPKKGLPVTKWSDADAAYLSVFEEIDALVEKREAELMRNINTTNETENLSHKKLKLDATANVIIDNFAQKKPDIPRQISELRETKTIEEKDEKYLKSEKKPNYSTDEFAIKAVKYNGEFKPLVLQNNFPKPLSYCRGKWKNSIEVPYFDTDPLEKRTLPGTTEQYPYLTVGDFLEPHIIKVTYPIDQEYFLTGKLEGFRESDRSIGNRGVPGDDGYLLPITKRFFDFFDPSYLENSNVDGQANFRIIKCEDDGVEVQLLIPIRSGDFVLFKRIYLFKQTPVLERNQGAIVPCRFDLGFFPLFHIDENVKQLVVIADGDTLAATKHYDYRLEFYRKDGSLTQPNREVKRQDKHKHQQFVTTKYYEMESYYDFLQISNGEHKATIVPRWKEKLRGSKPVTVAIDFGTINTFLAIDLGRGPEPLEINQKDRFLITLSEHWVNTNPVFMKEVILRTLAPYTLGSNEESQMPIRNVISEIQGVNYAQSIPGADISIPFFFGKRLLLKNEEYSTNFGFASNWSEPNNTRTRAFLSILLFFARNQILSRGGDLNKCKILWVHPSNMGEMRKAKFYEFWKEAARKYIEVAQFRRTLFCKEIRFGWFDFRVQSSFEQAGLEVCAACHFCSNSSGIS